jgi:hypothetical protein
MNFTSLFNINLNTSAKIKLSVMDSENIIYSGNLKSGLITLNKEISQKFEIPIFNKKIKKGFTKKIMDIIEIETL